MKNQAFTLIELLVVVLIIGILAAIAVPQYQKAVAKARFAELKVLTKQVYDAQKAYYLATGKYTNKREELGISFGPVSDNTASYVIPFTHGTCQLEGAGGGDTQNIYCRLYKPNVYLMLYLDRDWKQCCNKEPSNAMAEQLCKDEMQATSPYYDHCYLGKKGYL